MVAASFLRIFLPPLKSRSSTLESGRGQTLPSLGAARPLLPSADIGPGSPLIKLRNSALANRSARLRELHIRAALVQYQPAALDRQLEASTVFGRR